MKKVEVGQVWIHGNSSSWRIISISKGGKYVHIIRDGTAGIGLNNYNPEYRTDHFEKDYWRFVRSEISIYDKLEKILLNDKDKD